MRMWWSILYPSLMGRILERYLVLIGVIYTIYCGLYGLDGQGNTGWKG